MTTMPDTYAAKEALLEVLRSPALLNLRIDGSSVHEVIPPDVFFHPMQGVEGLELAHLVAPLGHSALLVRGAAYAYGRRVSIPQACRISILSGALVMWLPWRGEDPVRFEEGQHIDLDPDEPHGFTILEPYLSYNLFTPAFDAL